MRACIGFLVAPLAPAAIAWLLALAPSLTGVSLPGSFLALSVLYGYPLAGLLGIPLFLYCRHKNWLRFWQVALVGAAIGSVVPVVLVGLVIAYQAPEAGFVKAMQGGVKDMGALVSFGAAVGVLCAATFWLLALARLRKAAHEPRQHAA